jgi:hypothetical protein
MMFWSTTSRTQMRIGKKVMPMFVLRFRFCNVSKMISGFAPHELAYASLKG